MAVELVSTVKVRAVNGRTTVTLFVEQPVNMDELRTYVRNLKETRFPAEEAEFWVHAVDPRKTDGPRLIVTSMANIFTVDPYDDAAPGPAAETPEPAPGRSGTESDPYDLSISTGRSEQDTSA